MADACAECGRKLDEPLAPAPAGTLPQAGQAVHGPNRLAVVWAPLAIAFAIATALIAAIGLGAPPRSGDIPSGSITMAGVDPAAARVVHLDMSKPISISGRLPAAAAHADSVKLTFKAADVELGSAAVGLVPAPDGAFSTTFKTSGGRYLLAGKAAAQLELLQGDATLGHRNFVVRSTQSGLLTLPAIVSLVSAWALLSRITWLWRAMWKGRRRRFGPIRLAGLGALGGAVLVGLAWLALARAPMVSTVIACAALGAAGGLCGGLAALAIGDRARARRQSEPPQTPTKPAVQGVRAR